MDEILGIAIGVDLSTLTVTDLAARREAIMEAGKDLFAKSPDELTGQEANDRNALATAANEAKAAIESAPALVVVDTEEPAATPTEEEAAAVVAEAEAAAAAAAEEGDDDPEAVAAAAAVAAEAAAAAALLPDDGPVEITEEERELVNAARRAHLGAGGGDTGSSKPGAEGVRVRQTVMRASTNAVMEQGTLSDLAADYDAAMKKPERQVLWQASNWVAGTEFIDRDSSDADKRRIMGISGEFADAMNRADACPDVRYINDKEICHPRLDTELQDWISKFPMTDTCEVKSKDVVQLQAPDLFTWAYNEQDLVTDVTGATRSTGLVQPDGSILPYDPADENTWKPVSDVVIDCNERSHRLRSEGYIRKIGRGLDICSSDELEQALSMDMDFLAQKQSRGIITAFDVNATARAQVHAFDGTGFVNPAAALAYLFGEVLPAKEETYGADAGQATLVMPEQAGALFNVARYESGEDNNRYTADTIAEIAGVNNVVRTLGIPVAGGVPRPVPAVIDPGALGRTRIFSVYVAWRNSWRQGQGPGERGGIEADEKNRRGNQRMQMVEVDQVNIALGCLPVVRFDLTLCFKAGSAAATVVTC